MDGNMNLVHRLAAGRSVREPLYRNAFFMSQEHVDTYVNAQSVEKKQDRQVCTVYCIFELLSPQRVD